MKSLWYASWFVGTRKVNKKYRGGVCLNSADHHKSPHIIIIIIKRIYIRRHAWAPHVPRALYATRWQATICRLTHHYNVLVITWRQDYDFGLTISEFCKQLRYFRSIGRQYCYTYQTTRDTSSISNNVYLIKNTNIQKSTKLNNTAMSFRSACTQQVPKPTTISNSIALQSHCWLSQYTVVQQSKSWLRVQ